MVCSALALCLVASSRAFSPAGDGARLVRATAVQRAAPLMMAPPGKDISKSLPPKRDGFKKPDIMTYMDRYKKPPFKKVEPTFEDEIVGRPVPLEPDELGNWEPVLQELWTNVEEVASILKIKMNDQEDKLDFSRFNAFCEGYKTASGKVTTQAGQILSKQTMMDFGEDDVRVPILDAERFPFVKKLARRLSYQTFFEHQLGMGSETITDASWSRTQVSPTRSTPWEPEAPGARRPAVDPDAPKRVASDKDEADSGAKVSELRAAAEKSVAMSADDISKPLQRRARSPDDEAPVAAVSAVEEVAEPAWQQLVLNQCSPWTEGAIRFTGSMDSMERYPATAPPPRNVILGKLPPGCKTAPRSDLQNFVFTFALPLRGVSNAGMTVGGQTVKFEQDVPIIFDSSFEYSIANDGDEEAFVLLVDFWHPSLTEIETRLLGFFWTMWTQDKFHPSTRSRFTRRLARMKEYGEKVAEKRRALVALPKKRLEERKKRQQGGAPGK
ncbi:hypothetical protein M885DRAFT_525723 [Pelagophyceae sp. CCMP2097]|nr:hypothetical protein M885DRAFT_525723 [Pelagophyceae sp. CCMP2097]